MGYSFFALTLWMYRLNCNFSIVESRTQNIIWERLVRYDFWLEYTLTPAWRHRQTGEQGKGYSYKRYHSNIFFAPDYLQVTQIAINLNIVLP